jgi:murein DD-endopeptidase MepM/ murein hydrolase activator NlpD
VKRWILAGFLVIILLTGCYGRASGEGRVTEVGSQSTGEGWLATETPTLTAILPPTPTVTDPPTATPTPIPCDPLVEEYCIVAGHFVLQRPIAPPGNDRVDASYRYGYTQYSAREPHHGVEFPNPEGTPVLAAASGRAVFAGDDAATLVGPLTGFYGNVIVLEHHLPGVTQTVYTLYAHLSQINVVPEQTVAAGETIGAVGLTGIAVGSHLHFEVRLGTNDYRSTRNPELWLAPRLGSAGQPLGVLAMRVVNGYGE